MFKLLVCDISDGCVNNTELSHENGSKSYKTEMIALAVLLAVVIACFILVGAVLLYRSAGYGYYSWSYSFVYLFY